MKTVSLKRFLFVTTTCLLLVAGMSADAFAQSRGGGRGAGTGAGAGGNRSGGVRPVGGATGVGRQIIVVPGRRRGFPVDDFPTPTERNRRMPDVERTRRDEHERTRRDEHERTRREERERRDGRKRQEDDTRREEARRREATRRHDDEANRFQKLARWLDVSPERLQSFYLEAKTANPDLRPSQFFTAFVTANRLNGSNPNVTPQAILRGLDSGMSLKRTLVALGLSAEEANAADNWAERLVNHLKP